MCLMTYQQRDNEENYQIPTGCSKFLLLNVEEVSFP